MLADCGWQGNPPQSTSTGSTVLQSMVVEVRSAGPVVGEDAGDWLVDFGESHSAGVEDLLDGEVEPAVAGEQRPVS